jgi:hypothetical protein
MPRRNGPTVYDGFVPPQYLGAQVPQEQLVAPAPAANAAPASPWMAAPPMQQSTRQLRQGMFQQRLMGNPAGFTPAMQGRIAQNNPAMYGRMFGMRDQGLTNLADANNRANQFNGAQVGLLDAQSSDITATQPARVAMFGAQAGNLNAQTRRSDTLLPYDAGRAAMENAFYPYQQGMQLQEQGAKIGQIGQIDPNAALQVGGQMYQADAQARAAQQAGEAKAGERQLDRQNRLDVARLRGQGMGMGMPEAGTGPAQISSQEEYDALPAGSQYIDATGQVKTKR